MHFIRTCVYISFLSPISLTPIIFLQRLLLIHYTGICSSVTSTGAVRPLNWPSQWPARSGANRALVMLNYKGILWVGIRNRASEHRRRVHRLRCDKQRDAVAATAAGRGEAFMKRGWGGESATERASVVRRCGGRRQTGGAGRERTTPQDNQGINQGDAGTRCAELERPRRGELEATSKRMRTAFEGIRQRGLSDFLWQFRLALRTWSVIGQRLNDGFSTNGSFE